jgi:hypothetical protein
MKSKSKIILGLSAILAVSAGVAGVSTFAWFTASRTATLSLTDLAVKSRDGSLKMKVSQTGNSGFTGGSADWESASSLTGTGTTNDVSSGDGVNFYHPDWKFGKEGTEANSITGYTSNTSATALYFREFTLTFKNVALDTANGSKLNVYITSGCSITPATAGKKEDINAATATRMSILDGSNKQLVYWQYGVEGTNTSTATGTVKPYQYNYVSTTTSTYPAYTTSTHFLGDASTVDGAYLATSGTTNDFVDVSTASDTQKGKQLLISNLAPQTEVALTVRIWVEGTADVCTTALADGGTAAASLKFAGLAAA